MDRSWWFLAAVLVAPTAGCLGEMEGDFGDFEVQLALNEDGMDPMWRTGDVNHTFSPDVVVLQKAETGPMGGGGTRTVLEGPVRELTLHARIVNGSGWSQENAIWRLRGPDQSEREVNQPATETLQLQIKSLGKFHLEVDLGDSWSNENVRSFDVDVEARWTVRSSVHPVKAAAQPFPTNYDEMADVFLLDVPDLGFSYGFIHARTWFAGDWPSASGTDVDLELQNPFQQPVNCQGAGGGMNPQPDPNQAEEEIVYGGPLEAGKWAVRIGGTSPECGSTNVYYHNAANVPYEATIAILFHDPTKLV